ncbi:MAG TPA: Calx-beta domain-containing protein [Kiritimatiellia bacterium]|nr:Calx-beta domain-containing protein [Kiritimatiellia bacterium]HMP33613.1 Calx-beta domain-containing protein [Kiritimatiellia bacterium]
MKQYALLVALVASLASISARGQSVVINEFRNATPDVVELLVIQNNLDMRGMILKDYSSSGANDNGGGYTFTTNALWSNLPAGTLIVLRRDASAADTTVGGSDFNLDVGLTNTTYFSAESGTFDIAAAEIIMIKEAGSGKAGSTGMIHAFASGNAKNTANFTDLVSAKLATASGDTGANESAEAGNATKALSDFNGTDATGDGAAGTIGTWNNANNQDYILTLRGGGGPTTNVQFTASSGSIGENGSSFTVTVVKTVADGNVSAQITLGGTATLTADYTVSTTNITLDGATTSATVVVSIVDDGDTENNETVILTLANVVGGTLGAPGAFTLTINDNDALPPPSGSPWINEMDYDSVGTDTSEWVEIAGPAGLSLDDYELVFVNNGQTSGYNSFDLGPANWTFSDEGNGYGFFVIGRVNPAEGTADYTPATWTQDEIQNGPADSVVLVKKTGPVNVHTVDYEGDNAILAHDQYTTASDDNTNPLTSIYLTGGPGSGFADFSWTNTIGNATPGAINNAQTLAPATVTTNLRFAVASATAGEADGTFEVTIVKTAPDGNLSAQIALGGTATLGGGNDYTISATNVTLNGATTSTTVTITINDDAVIESAETVILTLTNAIGGGLTSPSVFTLTITDNDAAGTPPVLNAIGNKTTLTNALLTFAVSATATEGDPVVMTVSNAPSGSTFGTTNTAGTFTWTSPGPAGVYTVTFYAADDDGAASETITITVTNSPAGPGGGGMQLNLWFNELHYDNAGGDTNEGFEVAGPAGTDLSGYSVYLYDGTTLTTYSNIPLSGVIPDLSNGYGVIWYEAAYTPSGSLQNGTNDALALVYQSTGVIQFIGYEGSTTPINGPAAGIPSINIGAQSATALGITLSLCGTGTNYAEMIATGGWQTNSHSRGAFSPCQEIPAPAGGGNDDDGDLIPNDWEVQYFGSATGATANADTDSDGFINLDEYIAGTNPTNGASFFEIETIGGGSGARTLEFATVTGRLYHVLWTTNLVAQVWNTQSNNIPGSGSPFSLSDTNEGNRIYQIRTRLNQP